MQRRGSWFRRNSAPLIICGGALLTGVISFIVTVRIYDNDYAKKMENENNKIVTDISKVNDDDKIIAQLDFNNKEPENDSNNFEYENMENDIQTVPIDKEDASSISEEHSVSEIDVIEIDEGEYGDFIATLIGENANNNEILTLENGSDNGSDNTPDSNSEDVPEVVPTVASVEKELNFIMPVSGEIGMSFANEKLIYSNTLEEWVTHNGIDIIDEEAMPVKAIEGGTVESIKLDPRYGNTIIIKHNDEYKSIYSNLSTTDLVYVGKKVLKGEIISGVGAGFGFEIKEKPHIHLEILKNGKAVDPKEVIK